MVYYMLIIVEGFRDKIVKIMKFFFLRSLCFSGGDKNKINKNIILYSDKCNEKRGVILVRMVRVGFLEEIIF